MKYCLLDSKTLELFEFFTNGESWDTEKSIIIGSIEQKEDTIIPCGILKAEIIGEVVSINWIFVDPDHRHQGVGRGLVMSLVCSIQKTHSMSVLQVSYKNEDLEIEAFLKQFGFDSRASIPCYNISFNYLDMDARIKQLDISNNVHELGNVPGMDLRSFNNYICSKSDVDQIEYLIKKSSELYNEDSVCYIKNHELMAYIILDNMDLGQDFSITIKSIYSKKNCVKELAFLWASLYKKMLNRYPNGMNLIYSSFNLARCETIEKLFCKSIKETTYYNEVFI